MAVSPDQGVVISTLKAEMESISTDHSLNGKYVSQTPKKLHCSKSAIWAENTGLFESCIDLTWLSNTEWEATKWCEVDENDISGTDGNCNHKYYSASTGWSNWANTGKQFWDTPVALNYGSNKENFAVFGVGYDGLAWGGGNATSNTTFTWNSIGETTKKIRPSSISVTPFSNYVRIVAVSQSDSQLLSGYLDSRSCAPNWDTIQTACYCFSNPVIVSCKENSQDIFVFGENCNLMRSSIRNNGNFGQWQNLSGSYFYHPTAISVSPGRLDVFGIGSDAQLYRSSLTITGNEVGTFTQTCLGGTSISSPKIQIVSPGVYAVITEKSKGVFQQKYLETSTGVWTPSGGMTEIVPPAV
ncbi:uncharacterized protein EAE97_007901 [Botrytis byssoidea]|uniref:PLL-like beta propeller domain-containing protein n=1 Tax=Botrytis byssoidea TaxID=139641 RepID=A0A9P5M220_9HELO|nr:uncharacterized protein EAE97_007901 [Botrytis byssoidea]KAF7936535.1 hypothetical protein EAE97_007901 [Botrytis byssoidea]